MVKKQGKKPARKKSLEKDFLALSEILTGFSEKDLKTSLIVKGASGVEGANGFEGEVYPHKIYFETFRKKTPPIFIEQLFLKFKKLKKAGESDEEIGKALIDPVKPDPLQNQLAVISQNIIKLWYLNTWYGAPAPEEVSVKTFNNGLAWRVIESDRTNPSWASWLKNK